MRVACQVLLLINICPLIFKEKVFRKSKCVIMLLFHPFYVMNCLQMDDIFKILLFLWQESYKHFFISLSKFIFILFLISYCNQR